MEIAEDLAAGKTAGAMSANLAAITTADGEYQVSVKLGDHFEFVNYKVVDGKAQPN
jgi:hypothetical protein